MSHLPSVQKDSGVLELVEAELARRNEAVESQPDAPDDRELAAQEIEQIDPELSEVAAAIRGECDPAEAAEILIASLRDQRIPSRLKTKPDGAIRLAIRAAREYQQQAYIEGVRATRRAVVDRFCQLIGSLAAAEQAKSVYAAKQLLFATQRFVAEEFFSMTGDFPLLIKTMEEMIVAEDGNEIIRFLEEDAELCSIVASTAEGHRAGKLIGELQNRAWRALKAAEDSQ